MDELKEYIADHINLFNNEEPLHGHFKRFKNKLYGHSGSNKRRMLYYKLSLAASLFLFLGIGIYFTSRHIYQKNQPTLSTMSTELRETEIYFEMQIEDKYDLLKSMAKNRPKDFKLIKTDLKEMDNDYFSLQKDLSQNPQDERIVDAMINYYSYKLELLDKMIYLYN